MAGQVEFVTMGPTGPVSQSLVKSEIHVTTTQAASIPAYATEYLVSVASVTGVAIGMGWSSGTTSFTLIVTDVFPDGPDPDNPTVPTLSFTNVTSGAVSLASGSRLELCGPSAGFFQDPDYNVSLGNSITSDGGTGRTRVYLKSADPQDFLVGNAGAVKRRVAHSRPICDVRRFSSPADALLYCPPGGEVYFPPGEFTAPPGGWLVDKTQVIHGHGPKTILRPANNSSSVFVLRNPYSNSSVFRPGANNVIIRDLTIRGLFSGGGSNPAWNTVTSQAAGIALQMDTTSGQSQALPLAFLFFDRLIIEGMQQGLNLSLGNSPGVISATIRQCIFRSCSHEGVELTGTFATMMRDSELSGNGYAGLLATVANSRVLNCYLKDNCNGSVSDPGFAQIMIKKGECALVQGCRIEDTQTSVAKTGISFGAAGGGMVTGCHMSSASDLSTSRGIHLYRDTDSRQGATNKTYGSWGVEAHGNCFSGIAVPISIESSPTGNTADIRDGNRGHFLGPQAILSAPTSGGGVSAPVDVASSDALKTAGTTGAFGMGIPSGGGAESLGTNALTGVQLPLVDNAYYNQTRFGSTPIPDGTIAICRVGTADQLCYYDGVSGTPGWKVIQA